MNTNMNSGMLIGGFKAIGKSTLARKYSNVVDVESSNFEYVIDENMRNIPVEQRKGLKSRIKNPEFPLNYCEELIDNFKRNKIALFACKREVVDLLRQMGVSYCIGYPEEDMLDEIIARCQKRGNNERFISRIRDVYYADFPTDSERVIWLKKGEYLEDILLKEGILDIDRRIEEDER